MDADQTWPRRDFIRGAATAGAGLSAFLGGAPALLSQRNPNGRLGVACIGVGTRGHTLLRQAQAAPNVEIRVICDLYKGNIERARKLCANPDVRIEPDWQKATAARDVDAVIIGTPDFWHEPMTVLAAKEKKDIYVEKGLCLTLEEAKRMRQAVKENKVVLQLGHHYRGLPSYHKAREIYRSGQLGKVSLVRTFMDRTTDFRFWKFYTNYNVSVMPPDAGPDTIDWERFIAHAPRRPFDAERFFTWRCWWDYGTGIAGDLMSHLWDGVNMIMDMGIPEAAMVQGGIYFWKGDRDVPDTWNAVFEYPRQDLVVTYSCTQSSNHTGEITQILGRDQTMEVAASDICRTYTSEWKPELREKLAAARKAGYPVGREPAGALLPPDYVFRRGDLQVTSIMEDFLDCVRRRALPRCDIDKAFEEAVAIVMSVESFRRERKVRWDPMKEEIV